MAVLGTNSRAACFSHFHSFFTHATVKSTFQKKDAARESTPRTVIEDSRARAYGSEMPEARAIQRAIYGYHPGPFAWRTRRAVPNKYVISMERFLVKTRRHRPWQGIQNIADGFGIHCKGVRTCGSYVRSTCRAKRHPGRGLAPNANDGGGRHAPTTRVAHANAARLAPALPSAAPAERGWFGSIVASRDARWAVASTPARAENSQPRRNTKAHREYRCGSREERAVWH